MTYEVRFTCPRVASFNGNDENAIVFMPGETREVSDAEAAILAYDCTFPALVALGEFVVPKNFPTKEALEAAKNAAAPPAPKSKKPALDIDPSKIPSA